MKALLAFLTMSVVLVFTSGCGSKSAGIEESFSPATAAQFRAFHQSVQGSTELLGEAAYSIALALNAEEATKQLDIALADLSNSNLAQGNQTLVDPAQAIAAAAKMVAGMPAPTGSLSYEQADHIRDAYTYIITAVELNKSAVNIAETLVDELKYEMETNIMAVAGLAQAVDLVQSSAGLIKEQGQISVSILEMVTKVAAANNIQSVGPEQIRALQRAVAPETLK
jgi:hypothetical protein